ncbi:MAG: NADH-quinone oxidoreductase subunit I [Candidatus Nezhaarchaeota archaeon]|nr:NADH-quinone oxidoreductase subunit I [Candidatus Nezhaarchaeota archaeon]
MRLPSLLKEVWKNLFEKPATVKYPHEKLGVPESYRGKHLLARSRCTGCGLCGEVCPASAITMEQLGNGIFPVIDLSKCIFCYQCGDACPRGAIIRGREVELASWSKEDLILK